MSPRYPQRLRIEGGRLERWDVAAHTAGFAELCADAEVMRFLGGPVGEPAARDLSARIAGYWESFGCGLWAVVADDGRTAGFAGATPVLSHPDFRDQVEVGWRLARWAWGRGFATQGGRAGADAALATATDEVIALVNPDNRRLLAVIERLGMSPAASASSSDGGAAIAVFRLAGSAPPVPRGRGVISERGR